VEANLVIEQLTETATSLERKAIIETMDDKVGIGAIIQRNHWANFAPSYRQNVIFEAGQRLVEYEAVLLTWREKIKYNRIRPTTIVQSGEFTDDEVTTYGGPYQGVQTIKTQDFQPYIRTMPHSEYPSASTCICRLWYDHVMTFIGNEYGADVFPVFFRFFSQNINLQTGKAQSWVEPGSPHEDYQTFWPSIQILYEKCGESRLWGGMHLTESVSAADALCQGYGEGIYDYLQSRLGDGGGRRRLAEEEREEQQRRRRLNGETQRNLTEAEWLFNQYMDDYAAEEQQYLIWNAAEQRDETETGAGAGADDDERLYVWCAISVAATLLVVLLIGCAVWFIRRRMKAKQSETEERVAEQVQTKNEPPNETEVEIETGAC
jgi:hypothetical protein